MWTSVVYTSSAGRGPIRVEGRRMLFRWEFIAQSAQINRLPVRRTGAHSKRALGYRSPRH